LHFPDFGPGTCINCGFLCERTLGTHFLDCREVIVDDRVRGSFGQALGGTKRTIWCFARAANLRAEFEAFGDTPPEERMEAILERGRGCPRFFPYLEGFDPREHAAEQRAVEWEQNRRSYEEKVERERRRFEVVLFAALTFIGVVVTIVGVVHGW